MDSNYQVGQQRFDDADIHSAALCAWKEARGEGTEGMAAVLHVLRNRVRDAKECGFRRDLHEVIYGKNQFTSMSVPSDPEFNLQPQDGDQSFAQALASSLAIFSDAKSDVELPDPTVGAHYYANLHVIPKDGWFYKHIVLDSTSHPVRAQIGKHTFFA